MGSLSEQQPLHIVFFPSAAPGHMIPMVDTAQLLASRGVKATIVITPGNAPSIRSTDVGIYLIPFPSSAVGLPEGCENAWAANSTESLLKFLMALEHFRQPFDMAVGDLRPDCLIIDAIFSWSADVASQHGVPFIVFYPSCFFSHCASNDFKNSRDLLPPPSEHDSDSDSDSEAFVVPGIPHRIKMLRSHIPDLKSLPPIMAEIPEREREAEQRSYGVIMNSFYELEPDYVRHYREVIGRRAWHVGPVSLCSTDVLERGTGEAAKAACLDWLDSKDAGSVLFVCFGSILNLDAAQLGEVAVALEASGVPLLWAVRNDEPLLAAGGREFEERVKGRGMVVRGWVPQVSILNHSAVGGFLNHCGWNSCLEAVAAGVPMATWPLHSDNFYNERLLVDVLGVGVSVGKEKSAAAVERAVRRLMGDEEEAEGRRQRAREFRDLANGALQEGGSSFVDIGNLIKELTDLRAATTTKDSV